jgi:phage-related protein
MSANPIGLVVVAVAALVAAFVLAWKKSETFRRIVIGAWNAIKTASLAVWNALVGFFKSWGPRVLVALAGPLGALVLFVARNWGKIREAASAAFGAVVSFARSFPARVKSAVGSLGKLLYSAGQDVVRGLLDGIVAAWRWVTDKLKGLIGGLSGTAKKLLGISSPSRVFAGIGREVGAGMAAGIEKSAGLAASAAEALAGATFGAPAFAGAAGRGGPSVTIAAGAVQGTVQGGGPPEATAQAVRAGVEPALVRLAREIGRL